MKKIFLFTVVAATLASTFVSCKKEKASIQVQTPPPPPPPPVIFPVESGPVAELLTGKALQLWRAPFAPYQFELGINFISSANGNIKSLKLYLPEEGIYRVTLWKVVGQTVIKSIDIKHSKLNSWDDSVAVDIPIEANTEYVLSTNNGKVFHHYYQLSLPKVTFPMIHKSITLLGYTASPGSSPTFPADTYTDFFNFKNELVYGFVDFTFQKASSK